MESLKQHPEISLIFIFMAWFASHVNQLTPLFQLVIAIAGAIVAIGSVYLVWLRIKKEKLEIEKLKEKENV